jgi:hypothetical protein
MIGFCFGIKIILDRINRIIWIVGPSPKGISPQAKRIPLILKILSKNRTLK